MKNPFLVGEKVYLRPLERDDAPLLLPWVNDSEVIANLMGWEAQRHKRQK